MSDTFPYDGGQISARQLARQIPTHTIGALRNALESGCDTEAEVMAYLAQMDMRAGMTTKVCTCCTRSLPVERFAMRLRNGRATRNYMCRQCQKGIDAVRYKERSTPPQRGERPQYYRPANEKACDAATELWGRYPDAPRLRLFGLVGVVAMEEAA